MSAEDRERESGDKAKIWFGWECEVKVNKGEFEGLKAL